jgi:hypothetical protein
MDIRFGLAVHGESLGGPPARIDAPFLIARSDGPATPDFQPDQAFGLRWRLTNALEAMANGESGRIVHAEQDGLFQRRAAGRKDGRYDALTLGVAGHSGPMTAMASVTRLSEYGTTLGARFIPLMGAQSAETLLVTGGARMAAGPWTVAAEWRRGWTRAAAGGLLGEGGRLATEAWSVTAATRGTALSGDSFALRLSRPLAVIGSDFPLFLPNAYDYADGGVTTTGVERLNLRPAVREEDMEIAYAVPFTRGSSQGWLTVNAYRRSAPGNIAALPDDLGGAIRLDLRF